MCGLWKTRFTVKTVVNFSFVSLSRCPSFAQLQLIPTRRCRFCPGDGGIYSGSTCLFVICLQLPFFPSEIYRRNVAEISHFIFTFVQNLIGKTHGNNDNNFNASESGVKILKKIEIAFCLWESRSHAVACSRSTPVHRPERQSESINYANQGNVDKLRDRWRLSLSVPSTVSRMS